MLSFDIYGLRHYPQFGDFAHWIELFKQTKSYERLLKKLGLEWETCAHEGNQSGKRLYSQAFNAFYVKELAILFAKASREKRAKAHAKYDRGWTKAMDICFKMNMRECAWCGRKSSIQKDHMQPLSTGHGLTPKNVVALCRSCNALKSDLSFNQLKKLFPGSYKNQIKRLVDNNREYQRVWAKYKEC